MIGSALAFLVMFELLLRGSVPYLPLHYHKYLPGEMFMLAQPSKRALILHDYVAIFGAPMRRVRATGTRTRCDRMGATAWPIRRRM